MAHSIYSRLVLIFFLAAGLVLAAALSPLSPIAAAEAAATAPISFVQQLGDKALSSLTAKNIDENERQKRVRTLLQENFDIRTIGRFALGTYWKLTTEKQKDEYFKLFEDMIVRTYSQRFAEYSGQSFQVGNAIPVSEKDSIVQSQIIQKDGPPVNVEWHVRKKNGAMKIVDVKVESISMGVTQRSDFSAVIQRGGGDIEALLDSLREHKIDAQAAKT